MFGRLCKAAKLARISRRLKSIQRKVHTIMADVAALDSAIAAVAVKIDAIVVPTPTPVDLQPQVDAVNALGTKLDAKFPPAA